MFLKLCDFIKSVCTTFIDVQALLSLYIYFFRSQLEYCSVIFDKIENKSLSISVTNPKYSTPLTIILHFANILDYHPFNTVSKLQI